MSEPTVALALGAGGVRGLAHVHALEALDELGLRPVAIAGTSIGAIMGAAYASGMSGNQIHTYARERFQNRMELLADMWKLRPERVRQFLDEGGPRLGEINIERVADIFLPSQVVENFSQLQIPLQVVATDYYAHRDHVFRSGLLRPALAASAAIPAVFLPVKIDGDVFIDGGITNPAPFDKLAGLADIIVAIDVCGGPQGERGKRPRKVDVVYAASQLMQHSIVRAKAERFQIDICIRPDISRFRALDFLKTQRILEASRPLKEDLKHELCVAIDGFMKRRSGQAS